MLEMVEWDELLKSWRERLARLTAHDNATGQLGNVDPEPDLPPMSRRAFAELVTLEGDVTRRAIHSVENEVREFRKTQQELLAEMRALRTAVELLGISSAATAPTKPAPGISTLWGRKPPTHVS